MYSLLTCSNIYFIGIININIELRYYYYILKCRIANKVYLQNYICILILKNYLFADICFSKLPI